jgi:hypothetical protein
MPCILCSIRAMLQKEKIKRFRLKRHCNRSGLFYLEYEQTSAEEWEP